VPFAPPRREKVYEVFDVDDLYESNLKMFGDVFESLIGAVFMDSQNVDETWAVLKQQIMPYITVYANPLTLQDHSRTLLLELWNQKNYTKVFKCTHRSENVGNDEILLCGIIQMNHGGDKARPRDVFSLRFPKDAKHKVRSFYKQFYQVVEVFVFSVDGKEEEQMIRNPEMVYLKLCSFADAFLRENYP